MLLKLEIVWSPGYESIKYLSAVWTIVNDEMIGAWYRLITGEVFYQGINYVNQKLVRWVRRCWKKAGRSFFSGSF